MQTDCRLATVSDADAIAALVNRAYRPGAWARGWTHEAHLVAGDRTTPEQVSALLHARAAILVLCRDDTLVACVHVQGDADCAWIGMLATEPALQAHGLGKCMLQHAEDFAMDRLKAAEIRMAVLAARPELIAFYERRGYARTGLVADYPITAGTGQPRVEGLKVAILGKKPLPAFKRLR